MILGACARNELCHSPAQAFKITCGLKSSDNHYQNYFTLDKYEFDLLHAYLQLLVCGSAGFSTDQMRFERRGVACSQIT
jgi:hypothetical protein